MEPSQKVVLLSAPLAEAKGQRSGRRSPSNDDLLDTALDLFLESGFERTSIEAIAAATGVAKRTIYIRYGDKISLFKAALQRAIDDWIVPVEQLRATETGDLEETLLRIGEILVANVMSPQGLRLLRIINAEAARMPEIGAYGYQRGTERTLIYVADVLRRNIPEIAGGRIDADMAALAYHNLVVGGPSGMTAWGVSLDAAMVEAHTRFAAWLFLHALAPSLATDGGTAEAAGLERTAAEPADQPGKSLEEENRHLKAMLIEALLENATLKGPLPGS